MASEHIIEVVDPNIEGLRFGLRHKNEEFPKTYWFQLNETDVERSREILRESNELLFEVKVDTALADTNFFVHLGRDTSTCKPSDELSIRLSRESRREWRAKRAKPGKGKSDVQRIKKFHWRAAYARATLCKRAGTPVKLTNGDPVQVKLALGYSDDWYEKMYYEILDRLSSDRVEAQLTSSFDLFVKTLKRARALAEGAPALELYYRLRFILEKYERAIVRILRNPLTQLTPETTFFKVPGEEVSHFYQERGRNVTIQETHRARNKNNKIVPTSFVGTKPEQSLDNAPNRFAAYTLRRVQGLIKKVRQSLLKFIEGERDANRRFLAQERGNTTESSIYRNREESIRRHQKKANELDQTKKRLGQHVQKLPVSGAPPTVTQATASTYYDPRYAKLRELTHLLDFALRSVDTGEATVPFEVDAFHALYERWTFIQVVEALQKLGFTFEQGRQPEVVPLYHHPTPHQSVCTMYHDKLPKQKLEVWYERRYPKFDYKKDRHYGLETRYKKGRTNYREVNPEIPYQDRKPKRTPDIALEFSSIRTMESPEIVTLDPTLGYNPEKYEYRKGIRCFKEKGEDGESLKIVKAAWGIYPNRSRPNVEEYLLPDQDEDYTKGFIVLRPTEESITALTESLGDILKEVGIMAE